MRSGLSTVEQTLAPDSAAVLHEAVEEARRRGHAQTTSLHVAAALLVSPVSKLRQACIRSHPGSSAHPLHSRALQLCFNVALDRLPTSAPPPPEAALSNALVAAVKRAQAQQRRSCPEQQQQPLLAVKVELDYFILSILDDPSVSRVMSEASFSSTAVKSHLFRMANSASLSVIRPPSRTQFATPPAEDARRVADVLGRNSRRRNPVLVGDIVECQGVVRELAENISGGGSSLLPLALHGARLVNAELGMNDDVDGRLEDLKRMIEGSCGENSLILNVGDLVWLAEGVSEVSVRRVVAELGELVVKYGGASGSGGRRLSLMGMATCEMYTRCLERHPLMESTWDLQLVPIAASRPGVRTLPRFGGQGNICSSFQLHTTSGSFPSITLIPKKPIEVSTTCKMSCCPECMVNYKKEILLVEENKVTLPSASLSSRPSNPELLFPWRLPSEKSIHSSKGSDIFQACSKGR